MIVAMKAMMMILQHLSGERQMTKPGLSKARKVDAQGHRLQGVVVIGPPVVGQRGEVEEAFDARQVRAHRPRAAAVLQAAACAQVATEMVAIPGCLVLFYHNEMTQRPNRLIK